MLILFSHNSLVQIMYLAQVIKGVLLPIILVFMLLLVNNRRIMGNHTNTRSYNYLVWLVIGLITLASLALIFMV